MKHTVIIDGIEGLDSDSVAAERERIKLELPKQPRKKYSGAKRKWGDFSKMTEEEKRIHTLARDAWHAMKQRVRSFEQYKDVTICEEWEHNFLNFKEWFVKYYKEGCVIDKDILGGKLYSPDTCIFIPKRLNSVMRSKARKDKKSNLPVGVTDNKHGKYWAKFKNKYLGTFDTVKEAVEAFQTARLKYMAETLINK
jgi:uncharacterized protein YifE (UPF0438 family)